MTKSASESPRNAPEPAQSAGRVENRSQGQEGAGMSITARNAMPDTETLTPEQLAEIEARLRQWNRGEISKQTFPASWANVDALCRSLRAAWAELREWEDNHDRLCLQREQMYRDVHAENKALRTQNQTQTAGTAQPIGWISCGLRHGHDRIVDIVFENAECAKAFIDGVEPVAGPIVA